MANTTEKEKPAGGKVIQFPLRPRANARRRRPGPRGAKPPTQLISSVQLILSRLGLCGAD